MQKAEGEERTRLLDEKPFDFIERTKPEDRLDQTRQPGQLTRDNVNPNIPSVTPEETGDPPHRIAQSGRHRRSEAARHGEPGRDAATAAAPPSSEGRRRGSRSSPCATMSINEPPGSNIYPGADTGPNQLPGDGSALPPGTELPPLVLTSIEPDVIPVQPEEIDQA